MKNVHRMATMLLVGLVAALTISGRSMASAKEAVTAQEALNRGKTFLMCEGRSELSLGEPFSKGSYWLVPVYSSDRKRLSNLFVSRNSGEVSWPDSRSGTCSLPRAGLNS